jgi:tetraacyldisaccharide 4'-kinase
VGGGNKRKAKVHCGSGAGSYPMNGLAHGWYGRNRWLVCLAPASIVYCGLSRLRRGLYEGGWLLRHKLPVPVIIVGNLTVGGTGKTPLVVWLVNLLRESGYRPGVIARGYKGRARDWPQPVDAGSDPRIVGDEAVLIAVRCRCPVAVAPDRVAAGRLLLQQGDCDLIVSDDGLQHYALERDIEIAVIDGDRAMGNGWCLPAGPLRETPARLGEVDLVVVNGGGRGGKYSMTMHGKMAINLDNAEDARGLASFGQQPVHAVAGIGNPQRFFRHLRRAGVRLKEHVFADHHTYVAADLTFADHRPVIMTEKDAVKCRNLGLRNGWYVPVTVEMATEFGARVLDLLRMPGTPRREAVRDVE